MYTEVYAHLSMSIKEFKQYQRKSGQFVPHANVICKSIRRTMNLYIGCKFDQTSIPFT